MKKILLTIMIISLCVVAGFAQGKGDGRNKEWHKEMQEFKYKYLIQEIDLNEEDQKAFVEIYSQYDEAKHKLHKNVMVGCKALKAKENATDEEYGAMAEALTEYSLKEGKIDKEYFDKFKTILSKKQLFKLKMAERKFQKELMKMRGKKENQKKK